MKLTDIPLPEVYKNSADFRFFVEWIACCLSKIKYDIENMPDLLDPQRCPSNLLWLLSDTMGYKFDDRLPVAYNRLVLLYFMSMIYNRGSKTGITLASEVNLAQFNILNYQKEKEILGDRLEDTSIPVNSVYVTSHVSEGYIDIVYFSENEPVDACIEYVRPIGMYCFQHAGVRVDSRTKLSVDARLTNLNDIGYGLGPTHVGHYSRADYASMQKMKNEEEQQIDINDKRANVWYRNSKAEGSPSAPMTPGYRSLYSLQLSNNEHIVKSLIPEFDPEGQTPSEIFSLGYGPQTVDVVYPDTYLNDKDIPQYNLRYDKDYEESLSKDVYTIDEDRTESIINPRPAVNPVMASMGDAISMNVMNTQYTEVQNGEIHIVDK